MRSPPLVGRGLVVVRSTDYRVTALDAASGKRRWEYQRANVPLTLRSLTEMVYVGDVIIAGSERATGRIERCQRCGTVGRCRFGTAWRH